MKPEELLDEANEALAHWEKTNDKFGLTEEERTIWRIGYCFGRGVTVYTSDKLNFN
jgi:hypothetical protein